MAHISSNAVGSILDHYSDVIEGGNAYNSGTSFKGIPGRKSNDYGLRSGDDTPLAADAAGDATSIVVANTYSWEESRWVKTDIPGFFLLCTAGNAVAVGQARRITAYDNATQTFTVDAFGAAPGATGEFDVLEGFKRLPNHVDMEAEEDGTPLGYDRFFDLSLLPVRSLDWHGSAVESWEGVLTLRVRFRKFDRLHDARESVASNMSILASAMTLQGKTDHRDGTYIRALFPPEEAPELNVDDHDKIVASQKFRIIYRIDRGW